MGCRKNKAMRREQSIYYEMCRWWCHLARRRVDCWDPTQLVSPPIQKMPIQILLSATRGYYSCAWHTLLAASQLWICNLQINLSQKIIQHIYISITLLNPIWVPQPFQLHSTSHRAHSRSAILILHKLGLGAFFIY